MDRGSCRGCRGGGHSVQNIVRCALISRGRLFASKLFLRKPSLHEAGLVRLCWRLGGAYGYTFGNGTAGVSLAVPRVRSVFSVTAKDVRLGNGGPPGSEAGESSGWRAVTRVLRSCCSLAEIAVNDFVNVALPSDCPVCGGPLVETGRSPVCGACVARLNASSLDPITLCTRCGEALAMEEASFAAGMAGGECMPCRLAPPEFAGAVAFANYDEETRELLHLLKFNGMQAVAEHVLGEAMSAAILKLESQAASDLVVVSVPLFGARQRSRGFNQAELLAHAGAKRLRSIRPEWKLELKPNVLKRVKDTRAQFALAPHVRRQNLRGAFRVVDAEAIREREVLLIDDIMTTGATARECARVLLRAGAAKVWVATMARAQVNGQSSKPQVAMWDTSVKPRPAVGFG